MQPHRFYLPPAECRPPELWLTGSEAHHGLHVLRLQHGERVIVLDGAGHEFGCEVELCDRDRLRLRVLETHSVPAAACQITLVQAVPKGKLVESIIQKATELGVARIVPLLSERVVAHWADPRDAERKAAKWQMVAVEAIKQCGSAWLPRVETPVSVEQCLARPNQAELSLLGSLQAGSRHPRECFREFQREHGRGPASIRVWIGPEGDFSPAEIAAIEAAGAQPITLGRLVLRTETAAVYCLSILNYELDSRRAEAQNSGPVASQKKLKGEG